MPRYDRNIKYHDKVKNRTNFVVLEYDTKFIVDRILACLKPLTRKNAAEYVGVMLLETVAPYVPQKSGNLLKHGMYLKVSDSPMHAEIDLRVRSTRRVPYAFYQYYGNVWAPNYAVWEGPKFDMHNLKLTHSPATHTGWVSPKGKGSKHQTSQVLGVKRTITLKDGRVIHIDGYTNPESKPMWLDYVRHTPTVWIPYTKRVQREIKEMFDEGWSGKPKIKDIKKIRSNIFGAQDFNPGGEGHK